VGEATENQRTSSRPREAHRGGGRPGMDENQPEDWARKEVIKGPPDSVRARFAVVYSYHHHFLLWLRRCHFKNHHNSNKHHSLSFTSFHKLHYLYTRLSIIDSLLCHGTPVWKQHRSPNFSPFADTTGWKSGLNKLLFIYLAFIILWILYFKFWIYRSH